MVGIKGLLERMLSSFARGPVRRSREYVWRESASALREELARRAMLQAADFVMEHMPDALFCSTKLEHLSYAFSQAPKDGLALEFGVYKGTTINHLSKHWPERRFFGFDSFEGLPEDWSGARYSEVNFDRRGRMPKVNDNVTLVKGWFDKTLPDFLEAHREPVSFVHVDCDIYSSTKCVLDLVTDRLRPDAVLVFDEFFNYKGYEQHEYKAFFEWAQTFEPRYRFIGYSGQQVSLVVKGLGRPRSTS